MKGRFSGQLGAQDPARLGEPTTCREASASGRAPAALLLAAQLPLSTPFPGASETKLNHPNPEKKEGQLPRPVKAVQRALQRAVQRESWDLTKPC